MKKRLLTVLIASAFAAGSTIALAQTAPGTSTTTKPDNTLQQQRSGTLADRESVLQQESRSSASGAVPAGAAQKADKAIRSGDRKKDFAEQERALSRASESSANRHDKVVKTPPLTAEERRAMQKEAARDRPGQSQR
jgi:hypothetical protein